MEQNTPGYARTRFDLGFRSSVNPEVDQFLASPPKHGDLMETGFGPRTADVAREPDLMWQLLRRAHGRQGRRLLQPIPAGDEKRFGRRPAPGHRR